MKDRAPPFVNEILFSPDSDKLLSLVLKGVELDYNQQSHIKLYCKPHLLKLITDLFILLVVYKRTDKFRLTVIF